MIHSDPIKYDYQDLPLTNNERRTKVTDIHQGNF
ncbi:hypothetical protein BRIN106911_21760 [Brevibacillus invocatus]